MEQVKPKKLEDFFAGKPLSSADQEVLHSLYKKAEAEDRVLGFYPLMPECLLGANYFAGMTLDKIDEKLYREASAVYPQIGRKGEGLLEYFQITYAKPAMYVNPDGGNALFIFPVDQEAGKYRTYVFPLRQLKLVYNTMIDQNGRQLALFRRNQDVILNGLTEELVHAKRAVIEKTIRVFERETGIELDDLLRNVFRAVSTAALKAATPERQKETIASLIVEVIDSVDSNSFSPYKIAREDFRNASGRIARKAIAERRLKPMRFN